RRLARAPRPFARTIDQIKHDLRHLREGEDGIALPVDAGDARAVELQLLLERAAHRLQDVSVELVPDAVGIDDLTAVVGDEEAGDLDGPARTIDLDLG